MIPDTARIPITATITCFGQAAAEIEGYAYSLDNQPILDVVTFAPLKGEEIEMAGPYGTPAEDMVALALWKEARSDVNRSRLEEAFEEWVEGKRLAGLERRDELRLVG